MLTVLENEWITATVDSHGAELVSLVLNEDGCEYLWTADPAHWGRHAPVLFPIVGRLRDNRCTIDGKTYELTQHGFARDAEFALAEQTDTAAIFELRANAATLEKYPYDFTLRIGYRLIGASITVSYEVKNERAEEMFFSIGAHPGFRCPLADGESFDDYYLEFEQPETIGKCLLENGLLRLETEPFLQNERTIALSYPLFANDALVFNGLESQSLRLKSRKSDKSVSVEYAGFPYLGIWSKQDAPFVCIEPWHGVADLAREPRDFSQKEGICRLGGREEFVSCYRIEIR